jgi:hypothetical protein
MNRQLIAMLCTYCKLIDFTKSILYTEPEELNLWNDIDCLPPHLKPTDSSGQYYAVGHHETLEDLYSCSVGQRCHFCIQIRQELLHIRGHESKQEPYRGRVELRYYPHDERIENGCISREIFAVALTPNRIVKLEFDFVQYPCQNLLHLHIVRSLTMCSALKRATSPKGQNS